MCIHKEAPSEMPAWVYFFKVPYETIEICFFTFFN